jgi:phytoene dehydrogenase-like protein
VVLFDLTPKQILSIVGDRFSSGLANRIYKKQLEHYRYGPGIFKIDWALDGPIPFAAPDCHRAGTRHRCMEASRRAPFSSRRTRRAPAPT